MPSENQSSFRKLRSQVSEHLRLSKILGRKAGYVQTTPREVGTGQSDVSTSYYAASQLRSGHTASSTSNVLLLPEDIISIIFHTLESPLDLLAVSHVCHAWREDSMHSASLWARITDSVVGGLHYDPYPNHRRLNGPPNTTFLKMFLDRSKNADLSIELDLFRSNTCTRSSIRALWDILSGHARRVTNLQIESSKHTFVYFLSTQLYLWNTKRIRTWIWKTNLSRHFRSDHTLELTLRSASDFLPIMSLNNSMALRHIGFAWKAPPITSSVWDDKLEIHLDQLPTRNFDDYIGIMARSPQLIAFVFRGIVINGPYLTHDAIGMDHMQRLVLMDVPFHGIRHILSNFLFPNLLHLSLRPIHSTLASGPEDYEPTVYDLLTTTLAPLPMLEEIMFLTVEGLHTGNPTETFSGKSRDSLSTIWISLVYHGGFRDQVGKEIFNAFPNLCQVTFDSDIIPTFWTQNKCLNVRTLSFLWGAWVEEKVKRTFFTSHFGFPNVNRLEISNCFLSAQHFALIDQILCGTGEKRCIVLRDVDGISRRQAQYSADHIGADLIWEFTECRQ